MRKIQAATIMALLLGACTSVLEVPADTPPDRQFRLNDDYLTVYARANWQMRGCWFGERHRPPERGTALLPAEYDERPGEGFRNNLYPDQNYAVVVGMTEGTLTGPYPAKQIRVDKDGSGTIVSLYHPDGLTGPNKGVLDWMEYWARGGKNCQSILNPTSPPPL